MCSDPTYIDSLFVYTDKTQSLSFVKIETLSINNTNFAIQHLFVIITRMQCIHKKIHVVLGNISKFNHNYHNYIKICWLAT